MATKGSDKWLMGKDVADMLGVSKSRVSVLSKEGKFVRHPQTRLYSLESVREYMAARETEKTYQSKPATPGVRKGVTDFSSGAAEAGTTTYTKIKLHKAAYDAKMMELKFRAASRELIEAAAVRSAIVDAGKMLFQRLVALEARMAPHLTTEGRNSFRTEIQQVFEDWKAELGKLA